jgi:membrane protease YdiL (CAAX protease family)
MSNNHSLERSNITLPVALISNILIVLGLIFIANWVGGMLMYAYLGKMPSESDFLNVGTDALALKNGLLIGQIGGTFTGLVIIPMVYIFFLKKELKDKIFNPSWNQVLPFVMAAISITFVILPFIGIIADWNKKIHLPESLQAIEHSMHLMEEKAEMMTKLLVYYNSTGEMLLVFFTVALLPAVAEELVFRGILQNDLIKSTGNVHLSVFITAAVFSFIHFQFFGFFPRMILGIVLGYLYITSGNILISMLMHFTNNAMVVLALNLHAKGTLKVDPESSKDLPVSSIYLSIILSSALFYLCWRMYKQRTDAALTNV